MTTLNISLPDSMRAFIDEQIAQGGYSTASEYIRDLIRQAQKQAAKEKLDNMLLEGLTSGELIEVTDEWWQEKQEHLTPDNSQSSNFLDRDRQETRSENVQQLLR